MPVSLDWVDPCKKCGAVDWIPNGKSRRCAHCYKKSVIKWASKIDKPCAKCNSLNRCKYGGCIPCRVASNKARRLRDPLAARDKARVYYLENREYYYSYRKKWRTENREKVLEQKKRHRKIHKQDIAAYMKRNRAKLRFLCLSYRYKKRYGAEAAKPLAELFYLTKQLKIEMKEMEKNG